MTMIELMLAVGIAALLASLAIPGYARYVERMRVQRAESDLMQIALQVRQRRDGNGRLPDTLAGIPGVPAADPWGRPYVYLSFTAPGANRGAVRKDRNLVPINSEFDLYSVGRDGNTRPPLNARPSLDDVVVARDGAFVGEARDF
jgi:general secretion pathway protein G